MDLYNLITQITPDQCIEMVHQQGFYTLSTNKNNKNNKNTNKDPNPRPSKRVKPNDKSDTTDEDLINIIFSNSRRDSPAFSKGGVQFTSIISNKVKDECPNPLCDHLDYTELELLEGINLDQATQSPPISVQHIDDLISLGKTFHCKRNTTYYGINLKTLCKLVKPLSDLQNMVGLTNVKQSVVDQIIFFLQKFNEKERCNNCVSCTYGKPCPQNANQDMLHTVITGPPGVGKTELGKIMGHIYKEMGVLSKGHMLVAKRSDLVGKFLGHTAAKTQAFINRCAGGVMFIDEAYSLGNKEGRDSFSKECIDTLNQNLTEKKDFLCIIAGYKEQLEGCFFAYNPGLNRRFPFRYNIKGYNAEELMEIFMLKISKEGWTSDIEAAKDPATKLKLQLKLTKFFQQNYMNFPHYGGDMETLFLNCKIFHSRRCLFQDPSLRKVLTIADVRAGYDNFIKNRDSVNKKKEDRSISQHMMYM